MCRKLFLLLFSLLFCVLLFGASTSTLFTIPEYTIDNKSYVSLYDIAVKTEIQQVFDVISQRGKLYHKHHYAVFQSGYSVFVIDGKIYRSTYPVIRKNGEILLPSLLFKRTAETFFTDYTLEKRANSYLLVQRKKTPPEDIASIPDISPTKPANERITFIIIDPGHGGKDPGAIGGKVKEKELVLKISRHLRDYLKSNLKGVEIVMTRNSDIFIELSKRTEIANKKLKTGSNGVFISMHINASISSKSNGFETYFLSQNPSNEEARATASLENNVVVLEKKKHKPYQDVEYIEALMLTTQIQKESSLLANKIQSRMKSRMKSNKSRGVKKADFFVLRGSLMPAVLVEAGYITNKKERSQLVKSSYQKTVAKAVGEGVVSFVKSYNGM